MLSFPSATKTESFDGSCCCGRKKNHITKLEFKFCRDRTYGSHLSFLRSASISAFHCGLALRTSSICVHE